MNCLPCALTLLLAAAPPPAAAQASPNTLTPEETDDGWLMLFNGQTTSGWRIDGDAEVKDGALLLGGTRATRAHFPRLLGRHFDLRFEYKVRTPAPPGKEIWCHLQERGPWAGGGEVENMPGAGAGWVEVVMTASYDPRRDAYEETTESRNLPDGEFDRRGTSSSRGVGPPRHPKDLWLEIPAGAQIALRNVKFKGDAVAEGPPAWVWLLSLAALVVLVLGVAVLVLRSRRRTVAEDASP